MITSLVLAAMLHGQPALPGSVTCQGPLIVQPAPHAGQRILWLRPKPIYPYYRQPVC